MGKGDIKSGKGKRTNGSYGNTRKRKSSKTVAPVAATEKKEKVVKAPAEKKAPAAKKPAAPKAAAAEKAPAEKKAPAAKKTTKKDAASEE